jgi:hypothetical protein
MKKIMFAACATLALAAAPAQAWIEVEGSWWFMKPSGSLALGIDGLEGTSVDVQNDLGYGSRIGVPDAKIIIGKYVEFGAEFFQFSMSAQNTINRDVRFQDLVFPVSADVSSSLDATFIRGFVRINVGPDWLHGGVFGGGQYMDLDAKASSSLIGSAEKDERTGMPLVGAFLEGSPTDWLALRGSVCGFKWTFSDVDVRFVDVELGALLTFDWFYAGGGYRYITIHGEDTTYPVTADLKLTGPLAYVGVRW